MHYLYWIHLKEHTDILTEGYVGHASNFNKRMRDHKRQSNFKKSRFYNAVKKYGWDNLVKEIILIGSDQQYCAEVELKLRPEPHIGWNLQPGGSHSPSTLKEVKDKISNAMRGRTQSQKQILDRVLKNKGQKRSDVQKKNISEGLKNSNGTKQWYLITKPDGTLEKVFGLKPWCAANGLNASAMFKCANNKMDNYKGYRCQKLTTSGEHFCN
jgi:hypothetical protein